MWLNKLRWNNFPYLRSVQLIQSFVPLLLQIFISGGKQRSTGQMTHGSVETKQSRRLPQHPPQRNTELFWCIISPAYQQSRLCLVSQSSGSFPSLSLTSVTSSPCPESSLTHNECVFALAKPSRLTAAQGVLAPCCLSIIRGCHGDIGAGKNGEGVVCRDEWMVLGWCACLAGRRNMGGNARGHKDLLIIEETAETTAATANHSMLRMNPEHKLCFQMCTVGLRAETERRHFMVFLFERDLVDIWEILKAICDIALLRQKEDLREKWWSQRRFVVLKLSPGDCFFGNLYHGNSA